MPAPGATDLYGLPLERFVAERNALVRDLRSQGHREQAEAVRQLRKPSVAAWAVNQIIRTQKRDIEKLFAAGDALQQAQAELIAGRGNGHQLREGLERERALVSTLTEKASGLLREHGELTPVTLQRVSDTLHAAALDAEARGLVKDGTLERELHQVGLGGVAPSPARAAPRRTKAQDGASAATQGQVHGQAEDRAKQRQAAKRAEKRAREAVERADRALEAARQRRERAAQVLHQAEAAVTDAKAVAERAAIEHQRAVGALKRL